jgi:hypothetical protein
MNTNAKILLIVTALLLFPSSCRGNSMPVENVKVGVLFPMSGD